MLKLKLLFTIIFLSQLSIGQNNLFYSNYTWEKNPNYSIEEGLDKSIIALKDKIATEFVFEDNGLIEYFLEHKVYWLNSDEKIEAYNKIYLPYNSTSELKINKARVITKEGDIIELDDSKILTAKDEETGRNYKYFAFEGVNKGSFIEYFYVVKRYPRYSGNKLTFQSSFDKKNVDFDLYAPKNLIFKFKSYNNIPQVEKDTLTKGKLHWQLNIDELKGIQKEETSAYNASKGFVVYKLDRNTYSNIKDISSYAKVAQNIYNFYYPETTDKINKTLKKFIDEIKDGKELNEESLIRRIESYIKTNIYITEGGNDNLKDLNQVISKKIANETGILKLYTSLLRYLNIKHEIVITSDRQNLKFDKAFEANNFLTDFLIYFNKYKTYLSPESQDSRYGYPPAYLTDNYGLFIKEVKVGNFKSGLGKIKYIKPISANKTEDAMIIDVSFEENNLTNNIIKLDRSMGGYYAMYFQPVFNLIKQENRDEIIEGFAKQISKEVTITNKAVYNDDPDLFGIKPIRFVVDFNSEAFVEKAGEKYLFKVGELIGKQIELYQEKERVLPVENEFQRSYLRTINITIPNGYQIANLDDIIIDNSYHKNGEELLVFKSFYELNDNILKITADEHYRENIIDVAYYEDYRTVINSAADFNKLVLILDPK